MNGTTRTNTRLGWSGLKDTARRHIGITGGLAYFVALRRGLAFSLPLILIGAFALMLRDLPLPALQHTLYRLTGGGWAAACDTAIRSTFGLAALAVLIGYAAARADLHNQRRQPAGRAVSPVITVVVALACYFIAGAPDTPESLRQMLSIDKGLLLVLVVVPPCCWLFLRLFDLRRLKPPVGSLGYDPMIRDILVSTPAASLTILLVYLLSWLLHLTGITSPGALLTHLPAPAWLTIGNHPLPALAYSALCQLLWFFGAHGPDVLYAVESHVLVPASHANLAALAAGQPPPWIFTREFFDAFTRIGGSGSTLCLIAALMIGSRDRGTRRFALCALVPALCNVNEPLMFGLPLILNPVYLPALVGVPLLQTLTAYGAMVAGWVPHTVSILSWTTPALLSGYQVTHSWAGLALQAFNLALGIALYLPCVRLAERLRRRTGSALLERLSQAAERFDTADTPRKLLDLPGGAGRMAEMLALDLDRALADSQIRLVYQPQLLAGNGQVHGIEALLRWQHPEFGAIPPPLTVALAEDMGWHRRLGRYVLQQALCQRAAWCGRVPDNLVLAVNITPRQLRDPAFADDVRTLLDRTGVLPDMLELEITESTMLLPNATTLAMLLSLREEGVRIALDDFGMGHTSLRYLRALPIDTIKIDRSLTQADPNQINAHIVRSIVELARSLDIDTIVEGVEDRQQLARFVALGCGHFQGYLFSRPLAPDDCLRYIEARQAANGPAD